MEVHHHGHHAGKKNWKSYFWEFLMLFLAVTLGFFVENQREHYVEHQRELQFIRSMCEDLKSDTILLRQQTTLRLQTIRRIDSLTYFLSQPDPDKYGRPIYYYARSITRHFAFLSNDRTIQQLKNAGNLRLIRDQEVSDSLMLYDLHMRRTELTILREENFLLVYMETMKQIFDGSELNKMTMDAPPPIQIEWSWPEGNPSLLRKDKETLQKLINDLHFLRSMNVYNVNWNNNMVNIATSLWSLLKRKYYL
jgi:hypothetical protein